MLHNLSPFILFDISSNLLVPRTFIFTDIFSSSSNLTVAAE